jgi:hypothetical protein
MPLTPRYAARMTSLEALIRLSVRPPVEDPCSAAEARRYALEAASTALWNERAAVLGELDKLAREFEAAGKPNTAKKIRECAARINARLVEPAAGFQGSRPLP